MISWSGLLFYQELTMHSEEILQTPAQLALLESRASAKAVALIDEPILILSQKRKTVEEKVIVRYFHRLACVYGGIISLLHTYMSGDESGSQTQVDLLHRLRTVNENVASWVEELLKVLKYDLNYLEQYFEHDYCARLLSNQELLGALEQIRSELQGQTSEKSSG
jgi:hypothetical protein